MFHILFPFTPGVTYNWNITNASGSVISSGQGSNAIVVNYSPTFVSGNLTVTANNAWGISNARVLNVKATPATPQSITGPSSVCILQQGVPYSITPLASTNAYVWTVPSGQNIRWNYIINKCNIYYHLPNVL
ncbi:MAG: hypothetical protein IPP34_09050 [Bacteroidetes bacterium]|nr:hypothetical protein [Bacteroidota bacterium]